MKKYPGWQIAAAILNEQDAPMHYIPLTQLVIESGLSGLGKDAKTPEATLNKFLNNKPDYFERLGPGLFRLTGNAKKDPVILNISLIGHSKLLKTILRDLKSQEIENSPLEEGEKKVRISSYHERNPKLREQAIRIHGTKCMVKSCGFNFEKVYGEHGKDFIEVHHLTPISISDENRIIDPEKEMAVVCSNCHRMIHRKSKSPLSLEMVNEIIISKT